MSRYDGRGRKETAATKLDRSRGGALGSLSLQDRTATSTWQRRGRPKGTPKKATLTQCLRRDNFQLPRADNASTCDVTPKLSPRPLRHESFLHKSAHVVAATYVDPRAGEIPPGTFSNTGGRPRLGGWTKRLVISVSLSLWLRCWGAGADPRRAGLWPSSEGPARNPRTSNSRPDLHAGCRGRSAPPIRKAPRRAIPPDT